MHCNWSLPSRGWGAGFFLSQWPQETLGLGRVVERSPVMPHSGRGLTEVQRIRLMS